MDGNSDSREDVAALTERTADELVRGTWLDGHVRVFACITTNLVNEMQRRHDTWPVATAALGRTASIAAMMASMMKEDERLTVQIKSEGPLQGITVDADSRGDVRGYVEKPHVHLPSNAAGKLDVGGAVGPGMLYVMRDTGLRDYYQGSVELQSGEIADDFTYYFAISEQTPSVVGAGVLVETDNTVIVSGGFIVQLLAGHTEDDVTRLEEQISDIPSVTALLNTGITASGLMQVVTPGAHQVASLPLAFRCTCSRERMASVVKTLGDAEIDSLIADLGEAEIHCHFCNERYLFSADELRALKSSE